jgi:hypothetical protein
MKGRSFHAGVTGTILRLSLLPLRAPFLLLLLATSVYLGMHWTVHAPVDISTLESLPPIFQLYWSIECLQALVVVAAASMPDLLMRQVAMLMAASRVITLVVSLLLVTMAALYLLHLNVLTDVVILACSVLLARLDLTRIRVVYPPLLTAAGLGLYVLAGIWLGRWLHLHGPTLPGA